MVVGIVGSGMIDGCRRSVVYILNTSLREEAPQAKHYGKLFPISKYLWRD